MQLSAFKGDNAVRAKYIERLQSHIQAERLKPGPLVWTGEKGSVVGCILGSDDLSQWEADLGLPQWLAVLIDALSGYQPSIAEAGQFAIATLEAVRAGANLQAVGSQLILNLLDDLQAAGTALPAPLADSMREVRALHQRCVAGDLPTAAEWRAVRKRATAATDNALGPWDLACGKCIETAAWDPLRSHSAVFDTLRVWRNAVSERAVHDFGWDDKSDEAMGKLLQSLFERYVKDTPEPQRTVFDLLAEHHPAEDARLRGKYQIEREMNATTARRADALLHEALRGA